MSVRHYRNDAIECGIDQHDLHEPWSCHESVYRLDQSARVTECNIEGYKHPASSVAVLLKQVWEEQPFSRIRGKDREEG